MKRRVIINVAVVAVALATLLLLAGWVSAWPMARPLLQGGAPTVVSYQGQMKVNGSPYDGTGYFKFAVVDSAGTTTYWSNDGSSTGGGEPLEAVQLAVAKGLFNVLLGDTSLDYMGELHADVFSGPERYLRLWFSSDGSAFTQLSPDRRIAAVPYALQAEEAANADTVDGMHGADLEESAEIDADIATHAAIADAHHARYSDAEAFGAVLDNDGAGSGLDADTVDGMHGAGLEESTEIDADIAAHTAIADAHHARYSDAEAFGAVLDNDGSGSGLDADTVDGVQGADLEESAEIDADIATHAAAADAHHARYTDAEAFGAVLDNDGEGSGLDADTVDGQQASELELPSGAMVLGLANDSGLTSAGYIDLGSSNVSYELWRAITTNSSPSGRYYHSAVWTGSEMLVWGGTSIGHNNDGGRYDPATDSWTPITTTNAPTARYQHSAVWTGSQMLVWGGAGGGDGFPYMNDGGRYDPATDSWTPISTSNAPTARYNHTAVWTGSEMLVWGGFDGDAGFPYCNDGGRYDPTTNTWTPITTTNAPSGRYEHKAVWTGSHMLVWGGHDGTYLDTGGSYDPATDTWTPITTTNAPLARYDHTVVWTGSRMIVWGGQATGGVALQSGGRYHPGTDTWTPITTDNAPVARYDHTAVGTGSEMIVWGGRPGGLDDGGLYDPAADIWRPMTMWDAPDGRWLHTAVWTGSQMLVWGGYGDSSLNSGGRYRYSPVLHLYQKP